MAIYHCSIKIGSRANGQSAIAAAAYRSGDKLKDQETGIISDYTHKGGIVHSEISLCKNAPSSYLNREILWNEVHKIEKAKNAQLWREFEVALPKELDRSEQIKTVQDFVKRLNEQGMCVDWSLHDKGDGNPHAHIMATMRSITEDGKWAPKSRKVYVLDENGERILQKIDKTGRKQYKCYKEDYNDWNDKKRVEEWRAMWASCCNVRLDEYHQIDHRSFERQLLGLHPTIHEGFTARKMEKQGLISERCEFNREIRQDNNEIQRLEEKYQNVKNKRLDLQNNFHIKVPISDVSAFQTELEKRSVPVEWRALKNDTNAYVAVIDKKYRSEISDAKKAATNKMYKFDPEHLVALRDEYVERFMIYEIVQIVKPSYEKQENLKTAKEWRQRFQARAEYTHKWREEYEQFHFPKKKKEIQVEWLEAADKLNEAALRLRDILKISLDYQGKVWNPCDVYQEHIDSILQSADSKIIILEKEANSEKKRNQWIEHYQEMKITKEKVDEAYTAFKAECDSVPVKEHERAYKVLERTPMKLMLEGIGQFTKVVQVIKNSVMSILKAAGIVKPTQPSKQENEQQTKIVASEEKNMKTPDTSSSFRGR